MLNAKRQGITISILMFIALLLAISNIGMLYKINVLQGDIQVLKTNQQELARDNQMLITIIDSWQLGVFESTAYSPLDDRNGLSSWGDGSVMASGVRTIDNIDTAVAVDPAVIPLGSRVWIEGIGWRTALDTGGAIQGKRIDICMRSFDEAVQYAKRDVLVVYPRGGSL